MSAPKISKIFTQEPPELNKEEAARLNMIKNVRTTPRDERFPSSNQALHCWNRYNEWLLCVKQSGDEDNCKPMRQFAESICPGIWLESFDEQRDDGSFSGIGNKFDEKGH
jgi:cytochrome c oxidase subunit 6b